MFGSKNYLVSVLLVLVVFTVVQCVPIANDDPAPSPTLNRQKRTFFLSWWPYSSTEDIAPTVQPIFRVIVTAKNSPIIDAWNTRHATEIIGELEAAKRRIDETLQKLKNLSIKKHYDSDESNEDDSGERQPRPEIETAIDPWSHPHTTELIIELEAAKHRIDETLQNLKNLSIKKLYDWDNGDERQPSSESETTIHPMLRPYSMKYILRKTTSTTTPPDVEILPVAPTRTTPADIEVLPVAPTRTTPADVEVLPVAPTRTTPAAFKVGPVQPATTTTPAAVEVLPVEPTTTAPVAIEVRPAQPAMTTTTSNHTNEKVEPQQQVTTTETEDVKVQPDQPATTTTAEDTPIRIRPQTTTTTVSDDNTDVKTEPQQQATTASAATVEDSTNTEVENVQPAQPATAENDSSSTTDPEPSVEPRYAAESGSLENSKNNKKKVSSYYYYY